MLKIDFLVLSVFLLLKSPALLLHKWGMGAEVLTELLDHTRYPQVTSAETFQKECILVFV